ncbi:MAG: PfkB family carbohydrate kinase [Bacteroidota bacterium]
MAKKVITFGEVMMRLSPPGYAKFSQANSLKLDYGGGEANVAISCAYLGMKAAHVTRFPDDDLQALNFASAACALKHTVPGDVNMVSLDNVVSLMEGDTSGALRR